MDPSKTQLIESVFAGDGEIAARMRELDWSATPLGPVEQWPQALRTIVRVVLGSGYPMAICWSPDYVLLYNEAYRPIAGTRHPWALGRGAREVYPEAWDFIGPMYESVMARGQVANFLSDVLVPLTRNNYLEEVYIAFSASPIWDDNGRIGGVLNSALETTERVLEGRRRQVLRDLASRAAEARTEDEVWRVSAETLGQNCLSLPFAFLYEYRPSEHQAYLAGASIETDEALRPPVIDCHSENLWRFDPALARDGVVVDLGNRASGVPVPNWPDRPTEASVVPIRLGEYSEALGFLVAGIHPGRAFDDAYRQFVHRIAEQITIGLTSARAFEQERQRAEALAELDRTKTTFFSNVSHEFRTPLTLMLGPLEEVQQEAREQLNPQQYGQLVTAHRNALRLLKLVNTLLDFSRIEAGRLQAVYQPTDLAGYTSQIASMFRSAMENAGLHFRVGCQPMAEQVYVDRDMWEKIVLNLLSNAFKFTFEGEVAVTLKPLDGAVELQVRDTGVGIPEEHRERVFERFHRIEGTHARTYEGTGIGLALVQELAKLHGGSVRVESAVGVGSTFTVTIPLGKEHLPAERIQAAQPFASTTIRAESYVEEARQWLGEDPGAAADLTMLGKSPGLASQPEPARAEKRELIILADDNADMRRYLMNMLGDRYEVHAVADGRQALEATRELRPALVLTDIMMPRLDGFGLLRAIRDDSALAGTPVIVLSARAGEEWRLQGLQADADDYLVKPFTARELLARVAMQVRMANLRRETAEREERLRSEAELEREKLRASEERLAETSRLYHELQRVEAELQRESQNFRLIVDTVPGFLCTMTAQGRVEFVNQGILDYTGWTLDQLADWRPLLHTDEREMVMARWMRSVETGNPYDIEHRIRGADGVYRWFAVRGLPVRDPEGSVVRWYILITDIDDQKRAEEALKGREQELKLIIDTIPTLSWCNRTDGSNEFLSKSWHEYTGLSPEEARGWGWQAAFHPDDLPPLMKRWGEMIISGEPGEIEARLRRHDRIYRWFLIRAEPFRDKSGTILRWYGTSTDIDERKQAEERLQRSEAFLAQGQRISHTGSFGRNVLSEKLYWSEETYNIYELDRSIEPTLGWLIRRIHPEDRVRVQQTIEYAIHQRIGFDIEYRLLTRDNSVKHLHVVVQALENASGELEFVGAVTDITAAKKAQDKIRQSEKEARQLLDLSPFHLSELGPDGARLYANRASLDYYGITLEEWKDAGLQQVLHPQDAEIVTKNLPEKLQGGSPFEYEVRLKRRDGQYRWFHYRLSPVSDEQGRITRWYAAGTDVDDRKLAEQRLQEENVALREEIDKASMFEEIVGTSAALKKVLSRISKVAPTDSSVLITGETGTGKELVARAIHRRSLRSSYPFVSVNCSVIPRDLVASELFGHEKGSFTGATQRRLGRFELAEKGTIFLDEIGELPAETQIALLRVLQEHEFERVGGTETLRADVRVIAATNRNLDAAIAAGTFRSDLFYRLNVFPVEVPPLRERIEDIPLLVGYFLERYGRQAGKSFQTVNKKSLDRLQSYPWPGNIRELQNVIERSVIVSDGEIFSVDESWLSRQPRTHEPTNPLQLSQKLAAQEKEIIESALRECRGRVSGSTGAAARLCMPGSTLESKIKSLRIDKNRFKTPTRP